MEAVVGAPEDVLGVALGTIQTVFSDGVARGGVFRLGLGISSRGQQRWRFRDCGARQRGLVRLRSRSFSEAVGVEVTQRRWLPPFSGRFFPFFSPRGSGAHDPYHPAACWAFRTPHSAE